MGPIHPGQNTSLIKVPQSGQCALVCAQGVGMALHGVCPRCGHGDSTCSRGGTCWLGWYMCTGCTG